MTTLHDQLIQWQDNTQANLLVDLILENLDRDANDPEVNDQLRSQCVVRIAAIKADRGAYIDNMVILIQQAIEDEGEDE